MPGDFEVREQARREAEGCMVDDTTWNALVSEAKRFGTGRVDLCARELARAWTYILHRERDRIAASEGCENHLQSASRSSDVLPERRNSSMPTLDPDLLRNLDSGAVPYGWHV
ncbi:MAG: hypothetical protein R2855_12620 [Thermomicrobiales bacterium]